MRAGQLRHRVTIEEVSTSATNSFGEPEPTWVARNTVWASIEPLRGRELFEAQQRFAEVNHRIRMRYLDGLASKMRVLFGSRRFEIASVANLEERNRELEVLAVERT